MAGLATLQVIKIKGTKSREIGGERREDHKDESHGCRASLQC
jgi:hypothetical protein